MGVGNKAEAPYLRVEGPTSSPGEATGNMTSRNLRKGQLGGVIFGCKNPTLKECLLKQLFGLPSSHFVYVKNIDPGLPLFLFNYSDRRLHGIFEAASPGQMNINPYGWTKDASERTQYPAQVQVHVRMQCQPLPEDQFKRVIADNYYTQRHFWFELDHTQTSKLISLLASSAVAPSISMPQNTAKWRTLFQPAPSSNGKEAGESSTAAQIASFHLDCPNWSLGSLEVNRLCISKEDHLREGQPEEQDEKDIIYMKLKEIAPNCQYSEISPVEGGSTFVNGMHLEGNGALEAQTALEMENGINSESPSDNQSAVAQLTYRLEKLEAFAMEQTQKMGHLEQKLVEADKEILQLRDRCMMLESLYYPSTKSQEVVVETLTASYMESNELIFLVGGYDGRSWLSALNAYYPSQDVLKSLSQMSCVRSYASVAKLNGELYVFGGGNGNSWYDSVESYNLVNNQWSPRPSLTVKKGSLAGATLDDRIFAIGGGNGVECFSDVEMFDIDVGHWIRTRSMMQRRFALAAAELNGAIYAVGGYDGNDYLNSVERFDPREHSWMKIGSMNTKRGCHSVAVLNEKLYACGGFDGTAMVSSVEIFDPRLGTWVYGDSLNQPRGYSAAAAVKEFIYVIGGVEDGDGIVNMVERYNEGQGWEATNLEAVGKRSFFSAIVL